eukprot:6199206-Pleurochrysis_carterae.AAC.4
MVAGKRVSEGAGLHGGSVGLQMELDTAGGSTHGQSKRFACVRGGYVLVAWRSVLLIDIAAKGLAAPAAALRCAPVASTYKRQDEGCKVASAFAQNICGSLWEREEFRTSTDLRARVSSSHRHFCAHLGAFRMTSDDIQS